MKLFKYEGYEVRVAPEALNLKPFKKIWDRDKSKNKETAMLELSFLYFQCDPRSDYQYILDDEDRMEAVKEGLGLPKEWKMDAAVRSAVDFYKTFETASAVLLKSALLGVNKIREKLEGLDLDEEVNGKPKITLKDYMAVLKMVPEVASMLKEAEKTITDEMEHGEATGSMEKTLFDDGLDDI